MFISIIKTVLDKIVRFKNTGKVIRFIPTSNNVLKRRFGKMADNMDVKLTRPRQFHVVPNQCFL